MKSHFEKAVYFILGLVLGLLLLFSISINNSVEFSIQQMRQTQHQIDMLPNNIQAQVEAQLNKNLETMRAHFAEDLKQGEDKINARTSACFDDINRTLDKKLPPPKKNKHR